MHYTTIHDLTRIRRLRSQKAKRQRQASKQALQAVDALWKESIERVIAAYRASTAFDVYGEPLLVDGSMARIDLYAFGVADEDDLSLPETQANLKGCGTVAFYDVHPCPSSVAVMQRVLAHPSLRLASLILCDLNGHYATADDARRDLGAVPFSTPIPRWVVCLPAQGSDAAPLCFKL